MTVVSRKVMRSMDISAVKLMVVWKRLLCCRRSLRDFWPCSQMVDMSSVYHHQTFDFVLFVAIRSFFLLCHKTGWCKMA